MVNDQYGVPAPAEEPAVLSEVHMKEEPSEGDERISRYRYLIPQSRSTSVLGDSNGRSRGDGGVHAEEEGEDDEDEEEVVRRRRPRKVKHAWGTQHCARPTFETLTIVHRMATPLSLVGQQVWSAAFLLGDFVLTNGEFFAGAQVRLHPISKISTYFEFGTPRSACPWCIWCVMRLLRLFHEAHVGIRIHVFLNPCL